MIFFFEKKVIQILLFHY